MATIYMNQSLAKFDNTNVVVWYACVAILIMSPNMHLKLIPVKI